MQFKIYSDAEMQYVCNLSVKEAENKETHERVALKFLVSGECDDSESQQEQISAEMNALAIQSPHVINLKAVHKIGDEVIILVVVLNKSQCIDSGNTLHRFIANFALKNFRLLC